MIHLAHYSVLTCSNGRLQKYLQKASTPVHFLKSATLVFPHYLELQHTVFYRVHCCLDLSPISYLFSLSVFYSEYLAEAKPGRAWSLIETVKVQGGLWKPTQIITAIPIFKHLNTWIYHFLYFELVPITNLLQ